MKDNFRIVEFDNGKIVLAENDDAFMIKSFRELLRKDTGMMGDHDGRKKLKSAKELAYIIYMNDPLRSPGLKAGYTGKTLREDAIRQLELPDGWKPSLLLLECEKDYLRHIEGVSIDTYRNLLKGMGNTNAIVNIINEKMAEKLLTDLDDKELEPLIKYISTLIKVCNDYEGQIEALKSAVDKARKEREEVKKSKGGKIVTNSMDPANAVE